MEKIINETTENTVEIVNIDVDVQAFNKSLGNGIKSGLHIFNVFSHVVFNGRDTTPIVGLINAARKKKDSHAEKNIRLTLGAIFEGAEIITPKGKSMIIKIKGLKANVPAMKRLRTLVADKVSFRGAKWSSDISGKVTTTPSALTDEDYTKKAIALVKGGYNATKLAGAISEVLKANALKDMPLAS